jgi:hypothetical protein
MYKRLFQTYVDLDALTRAADGYPITVRPDRLGNPDTFVVEGPTSSASEIDALVSLFSID